VFRTAFIRRAAPDSSASPRTPPPLPPPLISFLQCGFFAGIGLLIAFGVATDYSVRLLIDLGVGVMPALRSAHVQLTRFPASASRALVQ
jgi:hypothetical protein